MNEPTHKTYELRTIQDLFTKIPPARVGVCLDELKEAIALFHGVAGGLGTLMGAAPAAIFKVSEVFPWTDDDRGAITVKVIAAGKHVLSAGSTRDGVTVSFPKPAPGEAAEGER